MSNLITYDRDIYRSYMKILSPEKENLDEKILLSRKIDGLLAMEKNYSDGVGQFWYDITGKQAFDHYCKANEIGFEFLERLILQICNQLECLEWNLIRGECLLLSPETIFISVSDKNIFFTGYPAEEGDIFAALREFMEFLLTKIDHSNKDAVHSAYELYEIILRDEVHVDDLKRWILDKSIQTQEEEASTWVEKIDQVGEEIELQKTETEDGNSQMFFWKNIWKELIGNLKKGKLFLEEAKEKRNSSNEMIQEIVYPNETEDCFELPNIHPTVCLTSCNNEARGILIYEGAEGYKDFEIGKLMCVVGKSHRVKLQIEKETISHFHAKIDWREDIYYIEDMNSTNGTFVNDELLNYRESRALKPGDVIRFADVKYRFL